MTAPITASVTASIKAFAIWFAHFVLCWVAVEMQALQPRANELAWVFTGMALAALAVHFVRLQRLAAHRGLAGFNHRLAQGSAMIASVAVVFTAFPSVVFVT